jgi:alpha-1,2-mannosyltransferase
MFFLLIVFYCAGRYLVVDSLRFEANDLSPVYVAASLTADGKAASLYDHHPYLFNIVPPGQFKETAARCGFTGTITPYVHLPLFAWLARPLLSIPFSTAATIVLLCNVVAVVVSLFLILRLAGLQSTLRWLCIAVIVCACSYPLRYGLRLGQTTPLVLLGITFLYYLNRSGHQKLSGLLLGLVISLKITPILFLCYFLIKKRWAVAVSTVITLLAIGTASVILAGWEINLTFLNNIMRLSGLSLASWNNQPIDGFLLRWKTGGLHLYDWHLLSIPWTLKAIKYALLAFVASLWFASLRQPMNTRDNHRDLLVFSLTLIISVMFSPIAWTHYLLFFIFPCLALVIGLMRDKKIPYRIWLAGGVILSFISMALPAPYLLSLLNVPLLHHAPLTVLSSGGFLGGTLLLITNFITLFLQKD